TERLEEFLRKRVPREAGVLRLDRDTTRRQERLEEILAAFGRGEAQVLVGTQMLSKGHHFPRVTLALVTDGDLGLNLPDYRAAERSFQLLVQVSGRAGRGGRPGRVVIQTRNPGHAFWNFVIHGDYEGFYRQEIESRRRFGYPPFVKLGLVRLSFPAGWEPGPGRMAQAARLLRERCAPAGVRALGPVPAPLAMLRGRQRFNCLLKGADWQAIRTVFAALDQWNPDREQLRLALDLDPVNML
ncbi:MAG: helicase-related protein, partial [Desulfovibrionaceae bacterium]